MVKPTNKEIDDVLEDIADLYDTSSTLFPGLCYEEGVEAAVKWMLGEAGNPLSD